MLCIRLWFKMRTIIIIKSSQDFILTETDHSHITFSDLVKLRLNSIRKTKPKYKKGDQVLDDYGNPEN